MSQDAQGTCNRESRLLPKAIRYAFQDSDNAMRDLLVLRLETVIVGKTGAPAARTILAEAWRRCQADNALAEVLIQYAVDVIAEQEV